MEEVLAWSQIDDDNILLIRILLLILLLLLLMLLILSCRKESRQQQTTQQQEQQRCHAAIVLDTTSTTVNTKGKKEQKERKKRRESPDYSEKCVVFSHPIYYVDILQSYASKYMCTSTWHQGRTEPKKNTQSLRQKSLGKQEVEVYPEYSSEKLGSRLNRFWPCLLYTSPSPRDRQKSRMPSSA